MSLLYILRTFALQCGDLSLLASINAATPPPSPLQPVLLNDSSAFLLDAASTPLYIYNTSSGLHNKKKTMHKVFFYRDLYINFIYI